MPKGPYGRIGLAVAANSDRVYAIIEAKEAGGLYRSDDGGDTWDLVNGSHGLFQRAWYYMHVIADPQDANTVYVADVEFFKSTDGGRNFNKIKVPHGDNHGLWIDPKNTKSMIASNDGGVTVSLDGGKSWTREDNQPTAQFYHVITDTRTPYYVYGAQQDNSTVAIASRSDDGAIGRDDWYAVGGGEAGYIAPPIHRPEHCVCRRLSGQHHALRPAHEPGQEHCRVAGTHAMRAVRPRSITVFSGRRQS